MISYEACIDEIEKLSHTRLKSAIAASCLGRTKTAMGLPTGRSRDAGLVGAGAGSAIGGMAGLRYAPGMWKLPAALGGAMMGGAAGGVGGALLGKAKLGPSGPQ